MDIPQAVIVGAAITGGATMVATSIGGLVLAYKTYHETKKVNQGVQEVHQVVNSKNDALVAKVSSLESLVAQLREDRRAAELVSAKIEGSEKKGGEL